MSLSWLATGLKTSPLTVDVEERPASAGTSLGTAGMVDMVVKCDFVD